MTIEEKAKVLNDFCESVGNDCLNCGECKIDMPCNKCMGDFEHNPAECNEAYEILFGKPEVEFVKVERDAVNHPEHYTQGGIECIAAIRASMTADGFCDYCKGNIIKYLWRWRDKGGIADLKKARVYLNWLIEEAEK